MKTMNALIVLALLVSSLITVPTWASGHLTAPPFAVATDNGEIKLDEFRGKVVYLDFWASWCAPCRAAFKWLNEAQEKYANQGLVVIAINVDTDKALAKRFLEEHPVNFRIGYDTDGVIAGSYQLKGMPSSFLIDRNGQLRTTHVGFRAKDKINLEDELQRLLAE